MAADWHGVLASKIIEPDRNNDYLTLSGTIPVIMRTLVSRAGLQGLFTVTDESADHKTTCQFDRYVDLYSVWSRCSGQADSNSGCVMTATRWP